MANWGSPWGLGFPWGYGGGPGPAAFCLNAQERILVQVDDTSGNRLFRDYMCEIVKGFGQFMDVCDEVIAGLDIDTAQGEQLDLLGAWIDLPRDGFNDTRYRTFLQIQRDLIRTANVADFERTGTGNNILELTRTFIGPSANPIILTNYAPLAFTMTIPGVVLSELPLLTRFICQAVDAAVYGHVVISLDPDSLWGSVNVAVANEGIWGSVNVAVATEAIWGLTVPIGGACCC